MPNDSDTTHPADTETTLPVETKSALPDRSRLRTRGHVEAFGEGRVCATAGCEIVLSRYNSGRLCWTHEQSRNERR